MTKQEALLQVRQAKSAHIRWRAFVQAMVAGLEVGEDKAPTHHKDCDFGHWFYLDGFKAFGHWRVYLDVEYAHELLHEVYRMLHEAIDAEEWADAERMTVQLTGISYSLLELMALFEEEIRASGDEVF